MQPRRELMAREGFFYSGKREEERIADKLVNVEFAMIQCMGEVMQAECTSCVKHLGPWAKCIRLSGGEGEKGTCGNCRWNGQAKRCSLSNAEADTDSPRHLPVDTVVESLLTIT
ncbi:hypothetical protein PMG11_06416 [Penicillium brasilianum]|uniref:Uncharacterized protein n=1 Tax=Penicillium brasilianum TaxID=104259 RepID=A0A0F7TRT3_PENBI|nr:hypothetical protein PMG11_06416 [Penicillium brasilianum]